MSDLLKESENQENESVNINETIISDPSQNAPDESIYVQKHFGFFKSIYTIAAFLTVIISVIFSSSEMLGIFTNDLNSENHIYGSGKLSNLCDIIIKNSFPSFETSFNKDTETKPPSGNSQKDPTENVPKDTIPAEPSLPSSPEEAPPEESSPPLNDNEHPIIRLDLSLLSYGKYYIYNDTSLSPNLSELASAKLQNYYSSEKPLVLIIHTHGTESYMPDGATYYSDDGEIARSHDTEENMIAVGKEFSRVLKENGIPTLHCTIMHDKESYRESYSRSADSIAKYLAQYPSIKYVFDLHRDSIMQADGELISAVATVNDQSYAQIMPVIGTGAGNWQSNLSFALKLRESLNEDFYNLCRPICLRESSYNQGMAAISVLFEIGTSGNSLEEAKRAAALTARTVAYLIKN